jgi:hypothetical protein
MALLNIAVRTAVDFMLENQIRPVTKLVDTGLNGRPRNHGDQCPVPKLNMNQKYKTFMASMKQKGLEVNCSQKRFNNLCVNPQTGNIDEKSLIEAKGGLQGEAQGLYQNLRRPSNQEVNLDFEIKSQNGYTHLDLKTPIDFEDLVGQGKDISSFPSHKTVAYSIGQDIPNQKERFIGLLQGPKSANEVLHLVNFGNIRNSLEKPSLVSAVLNGAEDAGCPDNIAVINFE